VTAFFVECKKKDRAEAKRDHPDIRV